MLEFGDELGGIEKYGIPWLVWIQLLVLFLLIFLLFSFNFSTSSDLANFSFTSSPSSLQPSVCTNENNNNSNNNNNNNNSKSLAFRHSVVTAATVTNRFQHQSQVRGNQSSIEGEIATNKGGMIAIEDPGSSSKERNHIDYHPCNYLKLAKLAFLKCLGLDFLAECSSSTCSSSEHKQR